ncbi:MAG: signal peptidase I [Crenarchaeota archaeon]|nr:MAG: signal peptidase I [Thermoproteota archaeon]RDJ33263.1 MAG: signal peptidase I [Thermoproteota archaeon]RDJ36234.1 MAG: signal peptidase I [Thermoproteota archaeon]RDJ38864.1 MAG: signal peptidase I [Thermoproteota archaeon]
MTAISISKGVIKDIIIVVVGVIIIWIGLQLVFGTQNPFYVVSSGSMIPVLQVYDVLVVQGNEPFEEVEVGDIIVFNRPSDHDRVIVHRVASIINEDPLTIRTKGDANPASIPGTDFPITEEEYIGQVAYVIPQVGYITRILQPPINYIIIVIIIGVMVAKQFSKKKNEKTKDASKDIDSKFTDLTQPKQDVQNLTDLDNIPKDSEYSKESGLNSNEKSGESLDTKDTKSDKKD